jgi:hypothetical protein
MAEDEPTNGLGRLEGAFGTPKAAAGLDRTWVVIAVILPALVAFVSKTSTIDLAYHVRTGLQILAGHGIPRVDSYTFGAAGHPWFDQQWLSQVAFAGAWRAGGWPTIIVLRAIMVSIGVGTLYLACRWQGARVRTAVVLSVGGFILALPNLSARPQIFAVPLFTATLWLLAAAWANLHGSFPLAILLVGLALADDLLERDRRSATRTALALVGVGLATAVTPFGPHVWSYVWELLRNPQIRKGVSEWEPPRFNSIWGAAFWISAGATVVFGWFRRRYLRPSAVLALLAFGYLGAEAGRNELWWGLVLPVVLAGWLPSRAASQRTMTSRAPRGIPIKVVLGVATVVLLPWWRGSGPGAFVTEAPTGVVTQVRSLPAGSRVFAPQVWGSWFELESPDQRVFLDSRIELYPPPLWQDYESMYKARPGWASTMARWRIDAVALPPDAPLDDVIRHSIGWTQVYTGSDGSVYVSTGS